MSFPLFSKKFKHDQPYRLNFYLEIFLKIKPYKIVKKEILFFFGGGAWFYISSFSNMDYSKGLMKGQLIAVVYMLKPIFSGRNLETRIDASVFV